MTPEKRLRQALAELRVVKHTGRYVDEFAFRLNEGNCKRQTLNRLDSFVDGMAGKRLSYADLIATPEGN